jgi:ribosomal protein S21
MSYRREQGHRQPHRRRQNQQRTSRKLNIKSKKPSHVTIYAKEGEYPERTIKRFLKKCKKEKVVEQYRKYEYYEKPSLRRHRAKKRRLALIKKANEENKKT